MDTFVQGIDIHEKLSGILESIDHFPISLNGSTMEYDHSKLLFILQEQEMSKFVQDKGLYESAGKVSGSYSQVFRMLNEDAEKAMLLYDQIERDDLIKFDSYLYLFVKQWGLSVKALYYHRRKDYRRAFSTTLECVALIDFLVREGVHTLIFRCAEQNRNISRIFNQLEGVASGGKIAGDILNYLFNGEAGKLYGTIFSDKSYWKAIPYIREGYAYDYFKGIIHSNITSSQNFEVEKQRFFATFSDLKFENISPDRMLLKEWISIKRAFYAGEFDVFLNDATQYLKEDTSKQYDIIKVSLMKDIKYIANLLDYRHSDELNGKIGDFLGNKVFGNRYVRALVSGASLDEFIQTPPVNDFKIIFPGS